MHSVFSLGEQLADIQLNWGGATARTLNFVIILIKALLFFNILAAKSMNVAAWVVG